MLGFLVERSLDHPVLQKSHHGTPNWQMPNHSHPQVLPINSVLAMSQSANMKKHSFGGLLCASTISMSLLVLLLHCYSSDPT